MFRIFRKNNTNLSILSAYTTDIHSHLIPGIDDGVRSLEESVSLIREMHAMGIRKIITTPHIRGDVYLNTPEIINKGLEDVKNAVSAEQIPVEIHAAAEYFVDDYFEQLIIDKQPLMSYGTDRHILIEFSHFNLPFNYKTIIYELQSLGYSVILAHPERYYYFHNRFDLYADLFNRGVQFQLNLVSLVGYYDHATVKAAEKLIDMGMFSFTGTDIHNKHYLQACKKAMNTKAYFKLKDKCRILNDSF